MTRDWQTVRPSEAGFVPDLDDRLAGAVESGAAAQLHGVVVIRNGRLVLERYGSGPDYKWNEPLGTRTFGPEELHDIRSVTKSVTSLLYGIAVARGRCPEPSEPLLPQFPEYPDLAADADRARLTVDHALTMTLGIEWNEDLPYTSPANSEIAMETAPDRYRFVLERPIVEEPGSRWHYCGGATALIGRLIERGVGVPLAGFAKDVLFEPLGIGSFEWMAGDDGVASAASGLRLAPRDLARIGQCVLNRGQWESREVVPADWLERALRPHVEIAPGFEYGYQWYLGHAGATRRRNVPWAGGMGNGGQRLFVMRELGLVVAIAAGAYDAQDQSATPDAVLRVILDGLVRLVVPEEHAPSTVPALVTISPTHEPEPLGEYVVVTDATSLDAFVAEVRSHGHIYAAEWRSLSDVTGDKSTMEREAVSFEDIRSQLYWLFDD